MSQRRSSIKKAQKVAAANEAAKNESVPGSSSLKKEATREDEAEFHTWVIGGQYARSRLHRNQMRQDFVAKEKQKSDDTCVKRITEKLEERRKELQSVKEKRVPQYVDKVQPALRADKVAKPERPESEQKARTRSGSPPKSSRSNPPSPPSSPPAQQPGAQAQVLRQRLQYSFAQTSENEAYGTLFPPLLTPYYRPMTFLRGNDPVPSEHSKRGNGEGLPIAKAPELPNKARETFSVNAGRVQRAQPQSGPKCFFPSGSPTAAYRYYTNFNVMARQGEIDSTLFPDLIRTTRQERLDRQQQANDEGAAQEENGKPPQSGQASKRDPGDEQPVSA